MSDSPDIRSLARALADEERSSKEWGDARSRLWKVLEADLRRWIKEYPLGARFAAAEPMRAFYGWQDEVLANLNDDDIAYRVIQEVMSFSPGTWEKTAAKAIAALKSKGRGDEKARVTQQHPEYPELLKQIREAKRDWNTADAAIKQTYNFRMMGGLARMGTREEARYGSLVKDAQRMERGALGKELTKY